MNEKQPSILQAISPIIVLILLILLNVLFNANDTLSGANQLALLIASGVAAAIAYSLGINWSKLMQGIVHTITAAIPALLILLVIGVLSGMWMISGVVPAMIYYGLKILRPEYFLPATVILSSIISVAVGSSWSTIATVGVALLGIGQALGFDESVIAGAIICGAYFGDKVSPLSDTTNLAAAVAGAPLFTHIRYMMITTIPSILISIGIFVIITFAGDSVSHIEAESEIQNVIYSFYNISPWLFIVPVLTILLIVKKVPAIPVLFMGALLGGVFAVIFQSDLLATLSSEGLSAKGVYLTLSKCMYGTMEMSTGNAATDELLTTRGMAGMLNTVWLIITAMVFGGVMEAGGFLDKIMMSINKRVKSTGGIVTATVSTSVLFNITAGDQYMAIVIPGKMYGDMYKKARLKPELLSRTLEDSGTVTSVLIPWNTCGATQASILGVATIAYAPFAFFCYLSPLMSMLYAWLNIKIRRYADNEIPK